MAVQLKLVRLEESVESDVDSISLLAYTDGFDLAANGWQEILANGQEDFVTEAMTLRGKGSSHDNLASKLQGLIDKIIQTGRHRDSDVEKYSVWLRAQLTNETGARQTLVRGAAVGKLPLHGYPALNSSALPEIGLAVDRKPLWENTSSDTQEFTGVSTVGGTSAYTTVAGDHLARFRRVYFMGESGGGSPLKQCWLGLRSSRYGTPANFQSTWSLRLSGTFGSDTTGATTNADATAKDGYKTITTFGTPGLVQRARIRVSDVTANTEDQRGVYTVLLRAKTTSTAVCRVRLADGPYGGSNFRFRGRVPISNTSWALYPMGTVQIPSPGNSFFALTVSNYSLRIDAELASGSGNLEMDCLILIPRDEGFVYSDGGNITYHLTTPDFLLVSNLADGRKYSERYKSGTGVMDIGSPELTGGVPTGTGIIVLASQRDAVSTLADTLKVIVIYNERWGSLRGSD